jgi:hypothetical protein
MTTRGLQYIVDTAQSFTVSRPKMVGQMITRSGRMRTAERASTNPFVFTITPQAYSRWEDVRDLIEGITVLDRSTVAYFDFGATGVQWVTEYQGAMSQAQINTLRVTTSTGWVGNATFNISDITGTDSTATFDYMRLTNLPSIGATMGDGSVCSTATVLFAPGDFIQFRTQIIGGVETANLGLARSIPLTVNRGSGTTVDVPVHRPFVFANTQTYALNYRAGADISVGVAVRWGGILTKVPDFKLLPGKIVEWTGDFELYEYITG